MRTGARGRRRRWSELVDLVATFCEVERDDLLDRRTAPASVAARQVAMYLAHVSLGLSFAEIARLTGRHPTTVAHACRLMEDRRDAPAFDVRLDRLENILTRLRRAPR